MQLQISMTFLHLRHYLVPNFESRSHIIHGKNSAALHSIVFCCSCYKCIISWSPTIQMCSQDRQYPFSRTHTHTYTHTNNAFISLTLILFLVARSPFRMLAHKCRQHSFIFIYFPLYSEQMLHLFNCHPFLYWTSPLAIHLRSIFLNPKSEKKQSFFTLFTKTYTIHMLCMVHSMYIRTSFWHIDDFWCVRSPYIFTFDKFWAQYSYIYSQIEEWSLWIL